MKHLFPIALLALAGAAQANPQAEDKLKFCTMAGEEVRYFQQTRKLTLDLGVKWTVAGGLETYRKNLQKKVADGSMSAEDADLKSRVAGTAATFVARMPSGLQPGYLADRAVQECMNSLSEDQR